MSDDEDASNRSKSDTRFQWIKDRILNVMKVKADALMKMMAEEELLRAAAPVRGDELLRAADTEEGAIILLPGLLGSYGGAATAGCCAEVMISDDDVVAGRGEER